MPHSLSFCLQIKNIMHIRLHLDRHTLYNVDSKALQLIDLIRIIGQQAKLLCSQIPKNLRPNVVLTQISS